MQLKDNLLIIERELSELDKIVLNFTKKLEDLGVKYVIVSGYVAILAGRSRGTEDIDIIIEEVNRENLEKIVKKLIAAGYWCLNVDESEAYDMLKKGFALRVAEEEKVIPNFEINFPTDKFDKIALSERLEARINSKEMYVSPLELQIAYKLYLESEKDWEDAFHLYLLFKENIEESKLERYAKDLNVGESLNELRGT